MKGKLFIFLKCFLFLISCICIFFAIERIKFNVISSQSIKETRKTLAIFSNEEKTALDFFLQDAISCDGYGHTLLKQKPMTLIVIPNEKNYSNFEGKQYCQMMKKGYEIWKKCYLLFSKSQYAFIEFKNPIDPTSIAMGLIYPNLCKQVIENSLIDFQKIVGDAISSEAILSILLNPEANSTQFSKIIQSDLLQGILYGFGRNNAYLYSQNQRDKLDFFNINRYFLDKYLPVKIFFISPTFVCDPTTDETKSLQHLYDMGCKSLYWTYFGRDFLETTLAFFYSSD